MICFQLLCPRHQQFGIKFLHCMVISQWDQALIVMSWSLTISALTLHPGVSKKTKLTLVNVCNCRANQKETDIVVCIHAGQLLKCRQEADFKDLPLHHIRGFWESNVPMTFYFVWFKKLIIDLVNRNLLFPSLYFDIACSTINSVQQGSVKIHQKSNMKLSWQLKELFLMKVTIREKTMLWPLYKK